MYILSVSGCIFHKTGITSIIIIEDARENYNVHYLTSDDLVLRDFELLKNKNIASL